MANELRIDSPVTRELATKLKSSVFEVENATRELRDVMAGLGKPWGVSDEVAEQFAKQYLPGAQAIVEGGDAVVKAVEGLGDGVDKAMAGYGNVEKGNARMSQGGNDFTRFDGPVGGDLPTVDVPSPAPDAPGTTGRR